MAKKESSIKSFVLRVDTETMDAIEKWAADEFRSTNGQLQWIIAEALRKSGRLKKKSSKTGNKPEESEGEQVEKSGSTLKSWTKRYGKTYPRE